MRNFSGKVSQGPSDVDLHEFLAISAVSLRIKKSYAKHKQIIDLSN
jgi:hypothetical protein